MAQYASNARWMARCAVLTAVVLAGLAGCKGGSKGPRALPFIGRAPAAQEPANLAGGVAYRQTAGESIAPVVIADDPAPTQAQPTGAGLAGSRSTLNGDANGITRETLNRSIQGAMGSLAACFTNITQDPMVAVSFEADPSGRPSMLRVTGAPPDAEHCIRNVMQGVRFPAFEGKGVQVDLPLSFHRAARPAPPASPSGEQQGPGVAPLFLQP